MVSITNDEHDYYLSLEVYALRIAKGIKPTLSKKILSAMALRKEKANAKFEAKLELYKDFI
tara:strand:+ start:1087 stop:1269 length:183 start_codon:yes stop_codon:yes gene_type:complete